MRWASCKALALAVLALAGTAWADPPADAPTVEPAAPAPILKGQAAPADGVFLTTDRALAIRDKCAAAEIERDKLKAELQAEPGLELPSLTPAILLFVAGVLVGGVTVAVLKK
jgi:hypothetical protein